MLINNSLYFIIKNSKSAENPPAFAQQVKLKSDQAGNQLAIYNLAPSNEYAYGSADGTYTITADHISFYEKFNASHAHLSQYHYTAYLEKANTHYQLHVYFDETDQVIKVSLQSIKQDESKEDPISPEMHDYFCQLATNKCASVLQTVRQLHTTTFAKLEAEYQAKEEKLTALSTQLPTEQHQYLELLNNTLSVLEKLSELNAHYKKIHSLFVKIGDNLAQSKALHHKEQQNSVADISPEEKLAPQQQVAAADLPTIENKSIKEFLDNIQSAKTEFEETVKNKLSFEKRVAAFIRLDQLVKEAFLLIDDKQYTATNKELHVLNRYLSFAEKQAISLLTMLLLNNQFNLALQLREAVKQIQEKLVVHAVKSGNEQLLDFILTHGNVPINTFLIDNMPLVRFCYKQHTPEKPKAKILAVLIKHNASLMLEDDSGLPIAHILLLNINHPLHEALLAHLDKTIAHPHFYRTLARLLQRYIQSHALSTDERNKLASYIEAYQTNKDNLKFIDKTTIKFNIEKGRSFTNHLNANELKAIQEDQEFQKKYKSFQVKAQAYMKMLSPLEKRRETQRRKQSLSNLDEHLKLFQTKAPVDKKKEIEYLDDHCRIYDLQIELARLPRVLVMHLNNNPSRQQKQIQQQKNAILAEINAIKDKYPHIYQDQSDKIKELKEMQKKLSEEEKDLLKKFGLWDDFSDQGKNEASAAAATAAPKNKRAPS